MNNAAPTWGPILIVDDDASMRALVAAILEEAGYPTICVECGESALLAASQSSLSAAVLDVNLDGLSGYEVCHELRRRHGTGLPIIFISGDRTEPFDRAAGMLLGADDYLAKPFAPSELVGCVDSAIERAKPESRRGVLTVREHEILELLASGLAQGAIATQLEISPRTVATHIERILAKLGVRSRAQAVALAYRDSLVAAP
jgi:DNA-binding NarL/FixJ family response regulator